MVSYQSMSEFKFACPVCGQHITADSANSGGQLECPTCFRKIVVPQAPEAADPKFILAASQVAKPRPLPAAEPAATAPPEASNASSLPVAVFVGLGLVLAAGAAAWTFRGSIFPSGDHPAGEIVHPGPSRATNAPKEAKAPPVIVHAVPTNITWTLSLSNTVTPETAAAGSLRGSGFLCERATLQGGALTLRQGKGSQEVTVTVRLFAEEAEYLGGKCIEVGPERNPPLPRVTVRWKNSGQQTIKENFDKGYALRVAFDQPANKRMGGRIYLCLPDGARSFVAGTFDAEIRKAPPPKSRPKA